MPPHVLFGQSAFWNVHAVGHHYIIAFKSHVLQILACSVAYGPDFVAAADVVHEHRDRGILKQLAAYGFFYLYIEFRMVGHDERNVEILSDAPREKVGSHGAVAMKKIGRCVLYVLCGCR